MTGFQLDKILRRIDRALDIYERDVEVKAESQRVAQEAIDNMKSITGDIGTFFDDTELDGIGGTD